MTSKVKEFLSLQRRLVILVLATLPVMFAYQNCGSVGSQKMLASGGSGPVLIVDPGFTDPILAATVQQVNQIKTQAAASEAQGVANCTSVDAADSLPVRLRGDVSGLTYTTQGQNPDGIDHDDVYELVDLVLRQTFYVERGDSPRSVRIELISLSLDRVSTLEHLLRSLHSIPILMTLLGRMDGMNI